MNQIDLIAIYAWYREQLNAITDRLDAMPEGSQSEAVMEALARAHSALRSAFVAEIFPDDGLLYPAVFVSAAEQEEL